MKRCIAFILIALLLPVQTHSIKPVFNDYGLFELISESPNGDYPTRFKAILYGVESWYWLWDTYIEDYIANGPYWSYIPGPDGEWGYNYVDNNSLANLIHNDTSLSLTDVSNEYVDSIRNSLYNDRTNGNRTSWVDPWGYWGWRINYMEEMYSRNDNTTYARANCWGTADYLAKDYQWADWYEDEHPYGTTNYYEKFPYIYLDGNARYWDYNYGGGWHGYRDFYIDYDLRYNPSEFGVTRAVYKGDWPNSSVKYLINAFDVIRIAYHSGSKNLAGEEIPPEVELNVWSDYDSDTVRIGYNLHCVGYLCTSDFDSVWVYEKHNYGSTAENPYGLNILGDDIYKYGDNSVRMPILYDTCYTTYFKKYSYNKELYDSDWILNWAGITP